MCDHKKFQKINVATWIQWHSTHILDAGTMRNIHIKVTLFYRQSVIWDVFADILNSENHSHCVAGNVYQARGGLFRVEEAFQSGKGCKTRHFCFLLGGKVRFDTLSHVTENASLTQLNFNLFRLRAKRRNASSCLCHLVLNVRWRKRRKWRRGGWRLLTLTIVMLTGAPYSGRQPLALQTSNMNWGEKKFFCVISESLSDFSFLLQS